MEVWKIIFLSKWVICRFHVNLPRCTLGGGFNQFAYSAVFFGGNLGKIPILDSIFQRVCKPPTRIPYDTGF